MSGIRATGPDHKEGRRDIQGMRAIAVLLVALGHAGVPYLDGGYVGVDVFFVISGFLITGLLLRRAESDARVPFVEFYARRALRIVPAAALVLVVTDVASYYIQNVLQAKETTLDSVWAAFFGANIRFTKVGTDYFAQDQAPSPFRHYWSLAVEEQYYLVWPLILSVTFLGLYGLGREPHGWRPDWWNYRRLGAVLGMLVMASLAWSIHQTSHNPTAAYFSSFTRAWELGVGALIAVFAVELTPRRQLIRVVMALGGLGAIGVAAALFTAETAFPGYAALLPVLGAGAMVVAGLPLLPDDDSGLDPHETGIISRIIGAWPFRLVGDVSYSFYLWHWPVLVLASEYAGHALGLGTNLALVAGSFLIAILTYRYVENPLRRGVLIPPDVSGMAVTWASACAAVLVVSMFVHTSVERQIATAASAIAPSLGDPGSSPPDVDGSAEELAPPSFVLQAVAAATADKPIPDVTAPPVLAIDDDWESLGDCSGFELDVDEIKPCQIGQSDGTRTIVLFGDSHAEMWVPAFREIAERDHLRVYPFTKPGCGAEAVSIEPLADCMDWYSWAEQRIEEIDPDIVVMAQHADQTATTWSDSTIELGRQMQRLADRVIVLGDSPVLPTSAPDCLLARGATLGSCAFPPNEALAGVDHEAAGLNSIGLDFIQVSQWFCADDLCPSVMGNVVVYKDTNHITATYARELAGRLGRALSLQGSDTG